MNIGMILDKHFPPDPRVEREAVSLSSNGYKVFLFCVSFDGKHEGEMFNYKDFIVHRVHKKKITNKLSAISQTFPFYKNSFLKDIEQFILKYKIKYLHVHDMVIADTVFQVNEKYKLPVILDLHENRPAIMREYGGFKNPFKKFVVNFEMWEKNQLEYIKKSNKLIVVTEHSKRLIEPELKQPKDIIVLPNSLVPGNIEEMSLDKQIEEKFKTGFKLFYFGDTGLRRGTDTIIYGVAKLREFIPDIKLIIVGSSIDDSKLVEIVEENDLSKHVYLEGWQDEKLFMSYALMSDLCLSPLKRNLHHDTTYANKIFQYMEASKPMIVSDCVAQEELVLNEKCGLVFQSNSVYDFFEKVMTLYKDEKLRLELGFNGRKSLENKYNWNIYSKNLISLYNSIK